MSASHDDKINTPDQTAIRVLGGLYDMVADETNFEPMFHAMDDFIDQALDLQEPAALPPVWRKVLAEHFEKADRLFDVVQKDEPPTAQDFVARHTLPAAVLASDGSLLAENEDFRVLARRDAGRSLQDCLAHPNDRKRLHALLGHAQERRQALLTFQFDGSDKPSSFLARRSIQSNDASHEVIQLTLVHPYWTGQIEELLQSAYGLTATEIAILRAFVASGSVAEIAKARGRSIRTVRTQLSQVFGRIGVDGQTELAFFLSSLGVLAASTPDNSTEDGSRALAQHVARKTLQIDDRVLEYLCYGPETGTPVLLIQPTHPPGLTPDLRAALAAEGLRVFAPLKPGSGKTTSQPASQSMQDMVRDYQSLLDAEGVSKAIVAGQASGGLYALTFARLFPARSEAVFLVDTGVPFKGRAELMALPKSVSRTFIPARYFPEVLKLPHRLIAANFHRSAKGEARVIDYFFESSSLDRALTRTDPKYYDITRDIIRFSFESTDRLVKDVSRWASDWQELLDNVANTHHIRFFHGAQNTMFLAKNIQAYVENHATCDAVLIDGCAQLASFQRPEAFAAALAGSKHG